MTRAWAKPLISTPHIQLQDNVTLLRPRWSGHGKMRNSYKYLLENPTESDQLEYIWFNARKIFNWVLEKQFGWDSTGERRGQVTGS